ncbi:hypothetical protein A2419_00625 [Candidatus Adlerbacteria bacterium RIFOXYC1_FULL_48_26]|uniref:Uncharacterized protein n=1 Tax=Candidatus Adlerbacteria bacterium RIFOXYC1_FULL_48_26 TaxID=1797247 RepID=A0A1F4Y3J0_9BACT|nr:MAG: hypothetical protein A2419_00625 [Candidatus Adlerbacteria bacterium RIFOXYC1_FULL_48_26]OGC94587.1 MAG: hypothetical protein A2389_01645 [Candidatus Adlerbacteria bacterium RIFOXYB1_FULL_48_10]OGC96544.1 MAG: hypothetical protein A2590_01125 [Candidatus Adlerbacteria bacterium RIFOXYD1_FULL_48_8]
MGTLVLNTVDPTLADRAVHRAMYGNLKIVEVAQMSMQASKPAIAPAASAHTTVFRDYPETPSHGSFERAPVCKGKRGRCFY